MRISAIAAISKNRVLGKNNDLIFKIPEDQKRFKDITTGHAVIMGRKTYESIGRPLPNRTNIIVTRDASYQAPGCIVVTSLDEAIAKAKGSPSSVPSNGISSPVQGEEGSAEIFIVGGGEIFTAALPQTDRLYLTIVDQEVEGDAFFPDYSEFKKVLREEDKEWNGIKYKFIDLER